MTEFNSTKILQSLEFVGEELSLARNSKRLSLKAAADKVGIKEAYLLAMEQGQFDKLPAGVYRRNFLREYATYLRLDVGPLIEIYNKEMESSQPEERKDLFSKQVAKAHYFLSVPRIIKAFMVGAIVLVCFSYLGFGMKKFVAAPVLSVISPADDMVTKDGNLEVRGLTEPEAQIEINGESVLANTTGYFTKMINLKEGLNIVTVTARKNYGEEKVISKQILVKK